MIIYSKEAALFNCSTQQVVDANILFSFFKKDSLRRELIERLPNYGWKLISPDYVIEELLNEKERIMKFSKIDEISFLFLISLLQRKIETIPKENFDDWIDKSKKLSPHKECSIFCFSIGI